MSGKRRTASREKEDSSSLTARRSPLAAFIVSAMEAVLLILVCLSPWVYGAVHPSFEFLLDAGIVLLLALWAVRILLERQLTWKKSGVALCLAGLFLIGVWQRVPLPRSVLTWLSPGTQRCYDQLLPTTPEVLSDQEAPSRVGPPPGSTLSLYPDATRRDSLRILAMFLVFAVVYNNLASSGTLFRLSIAALINGSFLSVFALAQFFGAKRGTVYWTYPTMGQVFGPFINRNDFAMYVNLCIGLGIGLLVRRNLRRGSNLEEDGEGSLMQTLHDARALWICAALSLMVSAVAFSRSRGGMLALVGAAVICSVLGRLQLGRSFRLGSLLLVAGVVALLSAWFGIGLLKERLATFGSSEVVEDRWPIWLRSLRIAADFPVWGTGYGTYGYIEPMYRPDTPSRDRPVVTHNAHNDYLEMLAEGGIVGLAVVVAALCLIYLQGYRALVRNRGSAKAGLALGGLFAFTTLALHSFGEFGMHIPAITLFAIVISAHLCALGQSRSHKGRRENDGDPGEYRLRLGGIAPVLGALAALGFGLVLCISGWKAYQIDRLRNAAFRLSSDDADQVRLRSSYLEAAASIAPDDAKVHTELGNAYTQFGALLLSDPTSDRLDARKQRKLALEEYLRGRNACPLVSGAQLGIADNVSWLKQGDTAEEYIHRVKLLAPGQAEMWYQCGLDEYSRRRYEDAWASWRHCLELSEAYLPQVLTRTRTLRADQLLEKVLPDNPDLLLVTAVLLYPDSGAVRQRRPYMEKALRLIESKPEGMIHRGLNVDERTFLARFDFARYLYQQGKLEEARRELRLVLAQRDNFGPGRELLGEITRRRR